MHIFRFFLLCVWLLVSSMVVGMQQSNSSLVQRQGANAPASEQTGDTTWGTFKALCVNLKKQGAYYCWEKPRTAISNLWNKQQHLNNPIIEDDAPLVEQPDSGPSHALFAGITIGVMAIGSMVLYKILKTRF